jgi:hypothetical protein
MIETVLDVTFDVPEIQNSEWECVIDALSKNRLGAQLEESIEAFGDNAESLLGEILDLWEPEICSISASESCLKGSKALVRLVGFRQLSDSKDMFLQLLMLCGAENIKTEFVDEDLMSGD